MAQYYKKVDAKQFTLTEQQKSDIRDKKLVHFEGGQIKWNGTSTFLVLLQQGENLHRMYETQWLVKHPEGAWQILWPHEFNKDFISAKQIQPI